jgi:hypothetical protein
MTLEEALLRYPGEEILMRVRDTDFEHLPIVGEVLGHAVDEAEIDALAEQEPLKSLIAQPEDGYYGVRLSGDRREGSRVPARVLAAYSKMIQEWSTHRVARRR